MNIQFGKHQHAAMTLHAGKPFWPIRDGLPTVFPPLTSSITTEFVVLGGGITGALLAYRLAALGREVVVVDRREVATGSTAATTAILAYELDLPSAQIARRLGDTQAAELHAATRRSVHELLAYRDVLDDNAGLKQRPTLKMASSRRDIRALHADFSFRQRFDFDVQWLTSDDLATQYGFARPGAVRSTDSGECDPYRLTHSLLRSAALRGARVFDRVPIAGVMLGEDWGDHVMITTEQGHVVRARTVIAATGYESAVWLPKRAATLRNTYAVVSEPLPGAWSDGPWPERALIWETARPYVYMRTTDDGRVLIGGEDDRHRTPLARDRRILRKSERLMHKASELLPHVALEPAYAWAGTFGETSDSLPRIGVVAGKPNLFVAACYGGNGITFAMLAGELLESRIKGETHPLAYALRADR